MAAEGALASSPRREPLCASCSVSNIDASLPSPLCSCQVYSKLHLIVINLHCPATPSCCSVLPAALRKVEEEPFDYDTWVPGQVHLVSNLQIFVLCSKINISNLIAPKIVKFVLLASLGNALTVRSIGWHVLVEKFFCRNSHLKTGIENKQTCFSP
jgi:hypothetical protein